MTPQKRYNSGTCLSFHLLFALEIRMRRMVFAGVILFCLLGGGIEWYSVKGCTKNITECFKRTIKQHELVSTHCCRRPLCNF
ncbi:PREDICTED: uncharacterized protein C9orf57 homolog [Cercocebus atys]|uniref:uncharacterized protein C9orf57 homolog n=1 Tax=Cercocebus atys TaxID=9531 RepID=UPI0005F3C139|nr:PREDICTED: uncharacterized protein C9orf57 homolog [Cercocebus atys]